MLRKCKCNCKCSETKDKPKLHPGDCKIRVIVAQEEQCLPEFLEVQHEYHYQDGPEWLREKLQQHIEESGDRFIRPPQFVVLDIGEAMNKVQYLCSNDIVLDAKETSIEDA